MAANCPQKSANLARCNCTYSGCDKHGQCCACLHYHLSMRQLPACCFPEEAEKTWDRSFKKFVEVCRQHYGIV
jgi:hypothetical protein